MGAVESRNARAVRRLLIAALLAAAAIGAVQPARADAPLNGGFGVFTVDPGNTDCVAATEAGIGAIRLCDPINITFPKPEPDGRRVRLGTRNEPVTELA
jgi:hypothetical protein